MEDRIKERDMRKWTEQQSKAIGDRGCSMLVSAAAGSGKTAVLVQRITDLILGVSGERVSIERMLIVTFTNAAASEMKGKIRASLSKELKKSIREKDREKTEYLRKQLLGLNSAQIGTFHKFAKDVIRDFFHIIDIEPTFSILSEESAAVIQEEVIDEIFDEGIISGDKGFVDFLDLTATDRSVKPAKEIILSIYEKLMAMPEPWQWFEREIDKLPMSEEDFLNEESFKSVLESIVRRGKQILAVRGEFYPLLLKDIDAFTLNGQEKRLEVAAKMSDNLEMALDKIRGAINGEKVEKTELEGIFSELSSSLKGIALNSAGFASKEVKEFAKERINEIKNLEQFNKKKIQEDISFLMGVEVDSVNATKDVKRVIYDLLKEYDRRFFSAKIAKKTLSFSDLEHGTLRILKNEEARAYYREKFQYIFIDEFQDTNSMQDTIIRQFAREDNVFAVGDIKQSIYGFRLAEPDIFDEYYRRYRDCSNGKAEVIDLNKNFRSRSQILDFVNEIFRRNMDNYDSAAMLYPGTEEQNLYGKMPEIHILNKEEINKNLYTSKAFKYEDDVSAEVEAVEESGEADSIKGAIEELKEAEIQAVHIAEQIKNLVEGGEEIFDASLLDDDENKGKDAVPKRPVRYGDIAILLRANKNIEVYYKALKEMGIASFMESGKGYFDTLEVNVFLNLLKVIDNTSEDIPLISVLHSEIFNFSAEELALIRTLDLRGSFSDVFFRYGKDGKDAPLREKCLNAERKFEFWSHLSSIESLGKFIWHILIDSGYYLYVGAMDGGARRQANLRLLIDKADKLEADNIASLYTFIGYMDFLKKRNVQMGEAKGASDDKSTVKIMTVHKSKGLEFPVVFVADLHKSGKTMGSRGNVRLHKKVGIGVKNVDLKKHISYENSQFEMVKRIEQEENALEEVRVFYVALTRAKERLYLVGMGKDESTIREIFNGHTRSGDTYMHMLGRVYDVNKIDVVDKINIELMNAFSKKKDVKINYIDDASKEVEERIYKTLNYSYEYEENRKLKSKYSVSEINANNEGKGFDLWNPLANTEHINVKAGAFVFGESLFKEAAGGAAVQEYGIQDFRHGDKQAFQHDDKYYDEDKHNEINVTTKDTPFKDAPLKGAELGNVYHRIMEEINFSKIEEDSVESVSLEVEEACARLKNHEIFTEEEIESIDREKIYSFICSELGKRVIKVAKSNLLYREKPFTLSVVKNLNENDKEKFAETTLIQGIIDLYFIEDGEVVLIDYKTNYWGSDISNDEFIKGKIMNKYKTQMDIYVRALQDGLDMNVKEAYLYLASWGVTLDMLS